MNFNIIIIKIIFIWLLGLMAVLDIHAQQTDTVDYPKVGDMVEDHTLTDLYNYKGSKLKLSELRGKWVILDFWGRTCGSCIAQFSKMDKLNQRFKDKLQLVMVGNYNSGEWGKKVKDYALTKELLDYQLDLHKYTFTVALDDAVKEKYDFRSLPYILVINPEGRIVAKTTSVNEQQVSDLLAGKRVYFSRAFSGHEIIEYNKDLPLLTTGTYANGGIDNSFSFRSLLAPYNYDTPVLQGNFDNHPVHTNPILKTGRLDIAKYSLEQLLRMAYFGHAELRRSDPAYKTVCQKLVLNIKDSTAFKVDEPTLKGLYSYSLSVPKEKANLVYIQQIFQEDLCRYFNIKVSFEDRLQPVYKLIITDKNKAKKLRSKNRIPYYTGYIGGYAGVKFENQVVYELLGSLVGPFINTPTPLLDETGIDYKLDFDIKADMRNKESINAALKKYGLEIVKSEKVLRTMIVTER